MKASNLGAVCIGVFIVSYGVAALFNTALNTDAERGAETPVTNPRTMNPDYYQKFLIEGMLCISHHKGLSCDWANKPKGVKESD